MVKADWECWRKLEEGFEQFHGLFLFDLVDDDQEDAHQDERIRQRWTVKLLQHGQEMDMLLYSSPSPPPLNSQVPNQDLCSKEMEGEKEGKDRENCKLQCGKW
jgi:hypothetical protein